MMMKIKTRLTIILLIVLPLLSFGQGQNMTIPETIDYINRQLKDYRINCKADQEEIISFSQKWNYLMQDGPFITFYGGTRASSQNQNFVILTLNFNEVVITTNGEYSIKIKCNQQECIKYKATFYSSYSYSDLGRIHSDAGIKIINRLYNSLIYLQSLIIEKYPVVYKDPFDTSNSITYSKPYYIISEFELNEQNQNEKIDPNEEVAISFNLKNSGRGAGKNLMVEIRETNNVPGLTFKKNYQINTIQPSQVVNVNLPIKSNNLIEINEAHFFIRITENNALIEELSLVIPTYTTGQTKLIVNRLAEVDLNIPVTHNISNHKYALVIGNEDYKTYQSGLTSEANVKYAENDAVIFNQYLIKTLGVPKDNITLYLNATSAQMRRGISKMKKLIESDNSAQIILYYAGHGLPEIDTKEQYLIPVDVNGTELSQAIKINDIIRDLGGYEHGKVIIILDACFSGGARNSELIAQRGVKIKPKPNNVNGKIVVFSASSGAQRAHGYPEKSHGIFTYFILKSLQEAKGTITLGDLADYLNKQVNIKSILLHNEDQTPEVRAGNKVKDSWMIWEL